MTYRLDDIDCVSARGHSALGGTLAIQAVWRYDRPVDMGALAQFHAALRRGRLGRVVAPAIIPAAGDRWSARAVFAPIAVTDTPIAAGDLAAWIAEQADAELRTYGGPAWRLAATGLDNGGSAVSLLVSHTLADGHAFCTAIADAVADRRIEMSYRSDGFGWLRLFGSDLWETARRSRRLFVAAGLALRLALTGRDAVTDRPVQRDVLDDKDFRLPTVALALPAASWHAAARARGGTDATLAIALLAAIAAAVGRTDDRGRVRMMMPVSTRADGDDRANALNSIDFEVDLPDGVPVDLAPLRATLKEKLRASAARGQDVPPLIPIAVALPRTLYGKLARRAATDPTSTVCSYLGDIDPELLRIDGRPATSFMLGLINQSLDSRPVVTARGGNLYGSLFESGDQILVRISGFHPPKLVDTTQLTDLIHRTLTEYDLTPTFY